MDDELEDSQEIIPFTPTPEMRTFAFLCAAHEFRHLAPAKVAEKVGIKESRFKYWQNRYDPYFTEYIEDMRLQNTPSALKSMLENVGREQAMKGEFNFWKAFAIREQVIKPDSVNLNVIPANLGNLSELSEEQIEHHANTILQAITQVENQGGTDMDSGTLEGQPQSNPRGTPQMPEEPLALDESLGQDRECSLDLDLSI